jgi:D-serine deaminase-like pyridoxal phosphate-dependent protein
MASLPQLETVPTPALTLDPKVLRRNIAAMAERTQAAGVQHWPHTKTHKSIAIGRLQREAGAAGITVATLREAECFAAAGFHDLLVAYPPIGEFRGERLGELARMAHVRVALDGLDAVHMLDEACRRAGVRIGYLWEVECGTRRCGTPPGKETAQLVATAIAEAKQAEFAGLMAFAGFAYLSVNTAELGDAAESEARAVLDTAKSLEELGIEAPALSVGTTPTAHYLDRQRGVTEVRAGNYVFNDATQITLGIATEADCAVSVLATVVSRPDPLRVILDSGSKALAAERLSPRTEGFGLVPGFPELRVERLFEEHAILTSETPVALPVGSRVRVIPNHSCATVNLHERMLLVEGFQIVDVWPVDARGWDRYEARGVERPPSIASAG